MPDEANRGDRAVYEISDKELVRAFLEVNPHLVHVLLEARILVKRVFDEPACGLEVVGDPETGDVALEARILTGLPSTTP